MDSLVATPGFPAAQSFHLPGWALLRSREPSDLDAAFAAGIALKSLDDLVRADPVWAGSWRARQALNAPQAPSGCSAGARTKPPYATLCC